MVSAKYLVGNMEALDCEGARVKVKVRHASLAIVAMRHLWGWRQRQRACLWEDTVRDRLRRAFAAWQFAARRARPHPLVAADELACHGRVDNCDAAIQRRDQLATVKPVAHPVSVVVWLGIWGNGNARCEMPGAILSEGDDGGADNPSSCQRKVLVRCEVHRVATAVGVATHVHAAVVHVDQGAARAHPPCLVQHFPGARRTVCAGLAVVAGLAVFRRTRAATDVLVLRDWAHHRVASGCGAISPR